MSDEHVRTEEDIQAFTEMYLGASPFTEDAPVAPQGRKADYLLGVCYQGPWVDPADGFNEHVRRSAMALHGAGVPTHLRERSPALHAEVLDQYPDAIRQISATTCSKYSAIVNQAILSDEYVSTLVSLASHRYLSIADVEVVNRFRAVYTVLERDRVSSTIARCLNAVGQVWVACSSSRRALEASGVAPEKIRIVPMPFEPSDPLLALRGRARRPGPPRFYHIGKWEPRKAQDKILEAFMLAFRPGEATLCIKSSGYTPNGTHDYPDGPAHCIDLLLRRAEVQRMGWTAETAGRWIDLLRSWLSPEQMQKVHALGDIYVSLARGEGVDMPLFDAVLAGNRVVHTATGVAEDCLPGIMVPTSGSVPCHPIYRWEPDAKYLDFAMEAAITAFRDAAAAVRLHGFADPIDVSRYSSKLVGKLMRANLEEMCAAHGADLMEKESS